MEDNLWQTILRHGIDSDFKSKYSGIAQNA